MKAILPLPSGGFGLTEVSPPEIGPGEILVEMRACGLCGTDLAKLAHPEAAAGVRLGHELAGVVRATGPGVTRFAFGDRVTAAHHVPCGACWACRHGNESMCPQFKTTQIDPCGFAELIRIPRLQTEQVTFRLPEGLSFEEASFTEPLACAVRAVDRSQALPGDRIAVVGGGGMGILIAQALLARAADPIVVDIVHTRLSLAKTLGVRTVINPARNDLGRTPSVRPADCEAGHPIRRVFAAELSVFDEAPAAGQPASAGYAGGPEDGLLAITIAGKAFLKHQVRSIVGTLMEVGRGKMTAADFAAILGAAKRSLAGPTAPAHGLTFVGVDFDEADLRGESGAGRKE